MRNIKLVPALIILLALPELAAAVTLDHVVGVADCNSWSADVTINFRPNAMLARVQYAVVLTDDAGTEVDRFDYASYIEIPATASTVLSYTGNWQPVLDGHYTVTANFTVADIFSDGTNLSYGSFTSALACGSAANGPVCLYPASYWAENPNLWPITSLEVSGQMRDQTELLGLLDRRGRSLLGFQLVRELIAAQLNLANGGSADIQAVVDEANAFMAHPSNVGQTRSQTHQRLNWLKTALFQYNRRGCDGQAGPGVTMALGDRFAKNANKAAIEIMSLGSIKAMYQ